jgi:hypothetical protein
MPSAVAEGLVPSLVWLFQDPTDVCPVGWELWRREIGSRARWYWPNVSMFWSFSSSYLLGARGTLGWIVGPALFGNTACLSSELTHHVCSCEARGVAVVGSSHIGYPLVDNLLWPLG